MAKSSNKKAIIAVGAVVIAAGLTVAAAIGSEGFKNKNFKSWFNNWGKGGTEIVAPEEPGTAQDGIMLLSSTIAANDYAAYGVSEQAISAKTLTAEFTPANATDKRVNWSIAWDNPADRWAKGKTVTDYVTLTPGANYAPTATVSVLQSFGESIIVTCTSRANSELSDNCKLEYVARFNDNQNYRVRLENWDSKSLTEIKVDFGENLDETEIVGAYTVYPDSYTIAVDINYTTDSFKQIMLPEDYEAGEDPCYTYYADGLYLNLNTVLRGLFNDVDKTMEYASLLVGTDCLFGYYDTTINCYYKGELINTFYRYGDIYVDQSLIDSMSIPATDITVTDKVIPF